jgi:cytidine deaminase
MVMQKQKLEIFYRIAEIGMLPSDELKLMESAMSQLRSAYAPYSNFKVGACVMTSDGNYYGGCNQENASYPLCICGERVALYHAGVCQPYTPITKLAITVYNEEKIVKGIISPCGACRQVISEFEMRHNHPIKILLKSMEDTVYIFDSIDQLLPFAFKNSSL